jgi:hypothetical protein
MALMDAAKPTKILKRDALGRVTFKRMRDIPQEWKALPPMQQAHALHYAKEHFPKNSVPQQLQQWIQEWQQNNPRLDLEVEHNRYLGIAE